MIYLVLAACDAPTNMEHADRAIGDMYNSEHTPSLVVGTGVSSFLPFEPEAELVSGRQGGWHIHVSTHFSHVRTEGLFLRIRGLQADRLSQVTTTVERRLQARHVEELGNGETVRLGDQLVFRIDAPSDIVGRVVRIEVEATPDEGTTLYGSAEVRIVDHVQEG